MNSKVNLKARIDRHSRLLKENLGSMHPFRALYHKANYNIVILIVAFLFPIYPLFSSFFYEDVGGDFYRGDIDESSILDSYMNLEGSPITFGDDAYLTIGDIVDGVQDYSGYNEIVEYEVQSGDSLGLIAQKFGISVNTIVWVNDLPNNHTLHPGEQLTILPVSGLLHKVGTGETIDELAKKYKIDSDLIIEQNELNREVPLLAGDKIIMPGAVKEVPKTVVLAPSPTYNNTTTPKTAPVNTTTTQNTGGGYSFTAGGSSEYVNSGGMYQLVYRTPKRSFVWGNCTWFVAQYKDVTWGGNAKDWFANAKAAGVATGSNPGLGAIVVFLGKGYNPVYGHVGIVVDVTDSDIIVKDMNYRKLNEVTTRKVPKNDSSIMGYIYVD